MGQNQSPSTNGYKSRATTLAIIQTGIVPVFEPKTHGRRGPCGTGRPGFARRRQHCCDEKMEISFVKLLHPVVMETGHAHLLASYVGWEWNGKLEYVLFMHVNVVILWESNARRTGWDGTN